MIPDWVNNYIGINFVEHGRDRDGCDCWGMIKLVLKEQFRIDSLIDFSERYDHTREREKISKLCKDEALNWEPVSKPQAGDVILLRVSGMPTHVGLVVSHPWMLHCEYGKGTVIECYERLCWKNRIEGFYRHVRTK